MKRGFGLVSVDIRAFPHVAEVSLGDLVLHEVKSARQARLLHGFWAGRLARPQGICAALNFIEDHFKELKHGA